MSQTAYVPSMLCDNKHILEALLCVESDSVLLGNTFNHDLVQS